MTDSHEKPIILVVITFFLALILVYVVYFRLQENKEIDTSWDKNPITQTWSQFASSNLWTGDQEVVTQWTGDVIVADLSPLELAIRNLASDGIKPWYAPLSVAEQLDISIQTAFTDSTWILYGYLGTGTQNELAGRVRKLWWNVLAIETRNDILSNLLRWDRVLFVNIPGITFVQQQWIEQRLLVAMIVYMGEDRWFIQLPVAQYYAHKADMKSHFEKLYNKVW